MKSHFLIFRKADLDKFRQIQDGIKTIETRAGTPKYRKIRKGDVLDIRCGDEKIRKTVQNIRNFDSVLAVYKSPDLPKILPFAKTFEEVEQIYFGFPGYREKIRKFGLIAFYID